MKKRYTGTALSIFLFIAAVDVHAQDVPAHAESDRGIVDQTLENVRSAVQEVILRLSRQLGDAAIQLSPEDFYLDEEDELAFLGMQAERLRQHVRNLRLEADQSGETGRARRLLRIERDLDRIVDEITDLDSAAPSREDVAARDRGEWLRPGEYGEGTYHPPARPKTAARHRYEYRRPVYLGPWVPESYPFATRAAYNSIPAIRYNRVEGFVLGIGVRPLTWESRRRAGIYGQGGYAFALGDWRYQIGIETKPGLSPGNLGLKIGAEYHRNTATNDEWKAPWMENSLAAFFFKNDFFDYFDTRGWSVYAVKRITPYAQAALAFRADEYGNLARNTNWALFGGDPFRPNLMIDAGDMRSLVATAEASRVAGLHSFPRGWAFRAEAELGQGLGGDFDFTRYTVEARYYERVDRLSGLSMRARIGYATDGAPIQKQFTLGGIGSVRAYPQNIYAGTKMLLGNAEYAFDAGYLFGRLGRDAQVFLFTDGGWVGGTGRWTVRADDLLAAVGGGISLDRRRLRLELAWPVGTGASSTPSLWFRLYPSF